MKDLNSVQCTIVMLVDYLPFVCPAVYKTFIKAQKKAQKYGSFCHDVS